MIFLQPTIGLELQRDFVFFGWIGVIKDIMKVLTVCVLSIIFLSSCEFWDVDTCLDNGGKWNYETKECEFGENAE